MRNIIEIKSFLIEHIKNRIVGRSCSYKGLTKTIVQAKQILSGDITFCPDFDLAEVPFTPGITTSVRFTIQVLVDIDGNVRAFSYIQGYYSPITIYSDSTGYLVDSTQATFSSLSDR